MHSKNIIHADIKLENVLLAEQNSIDQLRLIDFADYISKGCAERLPEGPWYLFQGLGVVDSTIPSAPAINTCPSVSINRQRTREGSRERRINKRGKQKPV